MTGFGKAESRLSDKTIEIEIKSLNGKGLSINTKLPSLYLEKEFEIRQIIAEKLQRGKINLTIEIIEEDKKSVTLNKNIFKSYYTELRNMAELMGHKPQNENLIQTIMQLPDVLQAEKETLEESEWEQVKNTLGQAIENIDKFRRQEGQAIEENLIEKISLIENAVLEVEKYEDERIETVKNRLEKKLTEFKLLENSSERFEQEVIYYLDKFDLNEEKQRLRQHCKYFRQTLPTDAAGKKLNFIAQEIGREINTTGSKANHHEIQKIVVEMKDNLEQIKEQLANTL